MQLAIALYNNEVDDDDELEFRKGDVLTVLIENPNGLNGWWLCEHKGKCGLCPGNRLQLISNPETSTMKSNEPIRSSSRLSTASMYDSLSGEYDIPITASSSSSSSSSSTSSSSNHDYDIPQGSDFISNSNTPTPIDSSPESSSRSSGIYSTIDFHLSDLSTSSSSSSSEFHTSAINSNNHIRLLSSTDLDQLQEHFRKLSIRSLILEKYRKLQIKSTNDSSNHRSFVNECRIFLHNYGCLLDRHTYKILKQNLLYELEHVLNNHQRIIHLSTQIIQLIKPIIELRIKQKNTNISTIPIDVFKKLNLEPIEELTNENENKKMTTSISTTQIYRNFPLHNSHASKITSSKTCHSNFLTQSRDDRPDDYDYIDDDYSISSAMPVIATDPLVKCYHRHILEHISTMFTRYTNLSQLCQKETQNSMLINEGKSLVVAGHKLVFILETLHEHVRHSTKNQSNQTTLVQLTKHLCDLLTTFIRLLKDFTNKNSINIFKFQHDAQTIMNIVKRIQHQCTTS